MTPVITALNKITNNDIKEPLAKLSKKLGRIRFIHDLERLTVAVTGITLESAMLSFPVGSSDISLYIGIDDAIEDIKNEYFSSVVAEGIWGASPLLFPLTTPNALAARASIIFDIRGESITFAIKHSISSVLEYATCCITNGYTQMAIAGNITKEQSQISNQQSPLYKAEFFFLEDIKSAKKRGARIYYNLSDSKL